jgi:hypothetical protein
MARIDLMRIYPFDRSIALWEVQEVEEEPSEKHSVEVILVEEVLVSQRALLGVFWEV